MKSDTKILIVFFGVIANVALAFWSAGYSSRTETPPLLKLTLTQAGCEYVARAGIQAEVKNGICTVSVRFRKIGFGDGGRIERAGAATIEISSGQVVGLTKLDDGNDEPWSPEHQKAIAWVVFSMLLMLAWVFLARSATSKGKEK